MKASEAYRQGLFNFCQFNGNAVTVLEENGLRGVFTVQFDSDNNIAQVLTDSEMSYGAIVPSPTAVVQQPAILELSLIVLKKTLWQKLFGGQYGR